MRLFHANNPLDLPMSLWTPKQQVESAFLGPSPKDIRRSLQRRVVSKIKSPTSPLHSSVISSTPKSEKDSLTKSCQAVKRIF
jgi:hypothetical protein